MTDVTSVGAAVVTKYYSFGGALVAKNEGGVLSYLHADPLGSVVLETGSTGAVLADQRYYAYGRRLDSSGHISGERDYTGQKADATGLLYYNARYYDPQIGQFLSPDTLVPDEKNLLSYNRYLYATGNPLKYNDPSGHFAEDELLNYHVFDGPNQMQSMQNEQQPGSFGSQWYYLLRAANLGDAIRYDAGVQTVSGAFQVANGTLIVACNSGENYTVSWAGLIPGNGGFNPLPSFVSASLTKATGETIHSGSNNPFRRYVQQQANGSRTVVNAASSPDYVEGSIGIYAGLGGHLSLRRDRYDRYYLGINLGLGIGGKTASLMEGNLVQDYVPDRGQIDSISEGFSFSIDGGYGPGAGVSPTNSGPQALRGGITAPGFAISGGYSWRIWGN